MLTVPFIYSAKVCNVVDGDTVDLEVSIGFHIFTKQRFRLLGVNTPELKSKDPIEHSKAVKAKEFTASKLPIGKEILVQTIKSKGGDKDDSFGRFLCTIYLDGNNFNESLIKEGHAVAYKP